MDLASIPAVDQHAHNLLRPEFAELLPFPAAFTEGQDLRITDGLARQTLCYRRSLRDIGALLGCEPTEEAILTERRRLGLAQLTERCFGAANLGAILLDDGFLPDQILPLDWHRPYVPTHRLLRIETVAQPLLDTSKNFDDFRERFRAADPPPTGVVGFKSIIAYRSGLYFWQEPLKEVQRDYEKRKIERPSEQLGVRDRRLLNFLVGETLDIAARHTLPFQFHTGFGDPDLDLRLANPLHLREILEHDRCRGVPIVLLHASYPYVREASYLAAVYPQVYVDFGLAIPFLSISGMRAVLPMLLELAPTGKVLYSSDAHFIPELFYLAAKWGRTVLGETLEQAVRDGDLNAREADEVAEDVLRANARRLYRLP